MWYKKPLREWLHALPGFGQVPVSNPGLEPGASGVRRPRASPLGNLTTVGHLADSSYVYTKNSLSVEIVKRWRGCARPKGENEGLPNGKFDNSTLTS